jgi:hypothetical protein
MTRYQSAGEHLVEQDLDSEVILVDLRTRSYFSLAESAVQIWKMLSKGYSTVEMLEHLEATFNGERQQLQQAIESVVEELRNGGAIVPSPDLSAPLEFVELAILENKREFHPPVIERFANLEFSHEARRRKRREEQFALGFFQTVRFTVSGPI